MINSTSVHYNATNVVIAVAIAHIMLRQYCKLPESTDSGKSDMSKMEPFFEQVQSHYDLSDNFFSILHAL